jgi:hypothetical protein
MIIDTILATSILTPEEYIQKHVSPQKNLAEIRKEFRIELEIMRLYGNKIQEYNYNKFQKIINKINFLMNACLKGRNKDISQFLADYGTVNDNDTFGINITKISQE